MMKCREEKELATDKKSVKSPTTDFFHALWRKDDISLKEIDFFKLK